MGFWRLILAWLVIADHTAGYTELFGFDIGMVAVSTFFFISGYLMPLAFESHYAGESFKASCGRFYANRLLRIYPLYWLSLALGFAIVYGSYRVHGRISPAFLDYRTYLQNFLLLGLNQGRLWGVYQPLNHLAWTLDVELQYYLIAPLLVLAITRVPNWTKVALGAGAVASGYLLLHPTGLLDVDRSLITWLLFFALGFGLYESPRVQRRAERLPLILTLSGFCIAAAAIAQPRRAKEAFLVFGFVIFSAHLLTLQKTRRLGSRDRAAGNLSYPTYVLNIMFLPFVARALSSTRMQTWNTWPRFLVGFAAAVVVATSVGFIALKLVGEPFERLRAHFKTAPWQRDTVSPLAVGPAFESGMTMGSV